MNCPNVLTGNARRKFCSNCRQSMAYHSKKRPAEILDYTKRLGKYLFRAEHIEERREDITQLASYRREKRIKRNGRR
jgi:hypothetical protein